MKKILTTLLILFFAVSAQAKLKVVATLPVFASIAQEIGKDQVEIVTLGKSNHDPHFIDPKPSYVVALSNADVLIHGGLELESGWLPPLLTQSRNTKISPHALANIDMSLGLAILEIPTGKVDRSSGDIHPSGNPHVWMDPRNVLVMSRSLAKKLSQILPAQEAFFMKNSESFNQELQEKIAVWEALVQGIKGQKIITYHKSFSYLAAWLELDVVGTIEPKPGIPPSTAHVDALIELAKTKPVMAVVSEDFYPKKMPEYLSEKLSKPFLHLPTQPQAGESYIHFMESIVQSVKNSYQK